MFDSDMMPTRILLVDTDAIEHIDVKACLTIQGYLVVTRSIRDARRVEETLRVSVLPVDRTDTRPYFQPSP